MKLDELKQKVSEYREGLKEKSGNIVKFSETGPVSVGLIDFIVSVLDDQEGRIGKLEEASEKN